MINKYTLIDPAAIQANLMQNTPLIKQFLQLYLIQIPVDLDALQGAMSSGQQLDISSKAHHIKPTMEYIGAVKLRSALQELETTAKNTGDLQQLHQLFDELLPQFAILLQEIKEYIDELP